MGDGPAERLLAEFLEGVDVPGEHPRIAVLGDDHVDAGKVEAGPVPDAGAVDVRAPIRPRYPHHETDAVVVLAAEADTGNDGFLVIVHVEDLILGTHGVHQPTPE